MARRPSSTCVVVLALVAGAAGAGPTGPARATRVTIHAAAASAFGGHGYGGLVPLTGATISQELDVRVDARSELRIGNVASTLDPGSIQLRDRTEPNLAIVEQRFVPGAATPNEILVRGIGEQVTVVTPKGEVTGTLRAVDQESIVVESGNGDARRLTILRRTYVQDVRIANGAPGKPSIAWRVATKQPGTHAVELTYRAEGLAWSADYLAVLDEAASSLDFTALATIKNTTGVTLERAELTLVSGAFAAPTFYGLAPRAPAPPSRYAIAQPVTLGTGQSVQVELVPRRLGAKFRSVVAFEAMPDPSPVHQAYPNTDCTQWGGAGSAPGRAELAAELDIANQLTLPPGRVRLFRRTNNRSELASEDPIATTSGNVRIRLATHGDVTGERRALACKLDETARTVSEKIEVKVSNKGNASVDVVVREFAWRWPVWRLEQESVKSRRAGPQIQEYRFQLAAKATRSVTYSLVYSW